MGAGLRGVRGTLLTVARPPPPEQGGMGAMRRGGNRPSRVEMEAVNMLFDGATKDQVMDKLREKNPEASDAEFERVDCFFQIRQRTDRGTFSFRRRP